MISSSTAAARSCVASVLASSSINYTLSRCAPPLLAPHPHQRILGQFYLWPVRVFCDL
ncbi:MAG: hypothetical protein NT164_02455 [Verrucomicrobiae bacterium]|nr:hypothetical protein [Verrucomicrobiae bacterium]